jgi:hypothetical protein
MASYVSYDNCDCFFPFSVLSDLEFSQLFQDTNVNNICTLNVNFVFPYSQLNDVEFKLNLQNVDLSRSIYDLNNVLQTRNMLLIDKCEDDFDIDYELNNTLYNNDSKYITVEEIPQLCSSQKSLSILQLNCRSLKKNFECLVNLLEHFEQNPSIISLSETWLRDSDQTSLYSLSGYTLISKPRKNNRRGGGVGLYISNLLSFTERDNLSSLLDDVCEYCVIEIFNSQAPNIIIISLYRPPDLDMNLFSSKFPKFLEEILGKKTVVKRS